MIDKIQAAILGAIAAAAEDRITYRGGFEIDWFIAMQDLRTEMFKQFASRTLLDGEETYRVSGDAICDYCWMPYRKHPFSDDRDWNGSPWLNLGCDGRKLKL